MEIEREDSLLSRHVYPIYFDTRKQIGSEYLKLESNGKVKDENTNTCLFRLGTQLNNLYGVRIEAMEMSNLIPRLRKDERTLHLIMYNGSWNVLTIEIQKQYTNLTPVGLLDHINDLLQANSAFNALGSLFKLYANGHIELTAPTNPSHFIFIQYTKLAAKLGFRSFTHSLSADHRNAAINSNYSTFSTGSAPFTEEIHDVTIPDLFLQCQELNTISEVDGKRRNILYVLRSTDHTTYHGSHTGATNKIYQEIKDYTVIQPKNDAIELGNAYRGLTQLTLSWHYLDGSLADLAGANWSVRIDFLYNRHMTH